MLDAIKAMLDIQELDIKMIRLMRLKKERLKELDQIASLKNDLLESIQLKKEAVESFDKGISQHEEKIAAHKARISQLESQQSQIKKIDEFNAMTQEMTAEERGRIAEEKLASDLLDQKAAEEEVVQKLKESLKLSEENSKELEKDIHASIKMINEEGAGLKSERDALAKNADEELLSIYERLIRNKKDRVIVPIVNRTCSGCHIELPIQHELVVRSGKKLPFCEHCSRIHYWQDTAEEGEEGTGKRRRRRRKTATS